MPGAAKKKQINKGIIVTAMIADDPYQTRILVFKCTLAQISPWSIAITMGQREK